MLKKQKIVDRDKPLKIIYDFFKNKFNEKTKCDKSIYLMFSTNDINNFVFYIGKDSPITNNGLEFIRNTTVSFFYKNKIFFLF